MIVVLVVIKVCIFKKFILNRIEVINGNFLWKLFFCFWIKSLELIKN